jgi:hypothetical protein
MAESEFDIKVMEPTGFTEVFRGFPQSLNSNPAIISKIKTTTSFYSLFNSIFTSEPAI